MAMRATSGAEGARRLPVGAELVEGGVHFRVWAPSRRQIEVVVDGADPAPLQAEPGGYFSGTIAGLGAGARYRFRLDATLLRPDPASRFQPEGPDGPSQVVDPTSYRWADAR